MTVNTNVIYLETFIERTSGLPPELQRMLNTIKALDEECMEVRESLSKLVNQALTLPPQSDKPEATDPPPELSELTIKIEQTQQKLLHCASEKVELALQAYDLLDMYVVDLEDTLEEFQAELEENQPFCGPSISSDLFQPYDSSARPKRSDWEDGPSTTHPKKKARREHDDGGATSRKGQSATPHALEGDFVPLEEEQTPFLNPPIPGLHDSSRELQMPGRLLVYSDITPALKGRQAEMFWPDDNLWYVIEIRSVDLDNKKAIILYRTGDTEELDLQEIIRDGHMSLIAEDAVRPFDS